MNDNSIIINKEYIVNHRNELLPPTIGKFTASVICIFISLFFVLSIYFRNKSTNRNDPEVIKKRIVRVAFSTLVSMIILYLLIPNSNNKFYIFLQIIGIPLNLIELIKSFIPLLLTIILFIGPIIMSWYDEDDLFDCLLSPSTLFTDHQMLRDIIIGPLVEELVFRSVICPILFFVGGFSIRYIIIVSPFLFGFAHAHHIFPLKKETLLFNLFKIIIQICFTSLFGMFSAFIFFRTGNILSCFLVHSFCNLVGLPNFSGIFDHPNKTIVGSMFVIGLIGFSSLVMTLTSPDYYNSIYNLLEAW